VSGLPFGLRAALRRCVSRRGVVRATPEAVVSAWWNALLLSQRAVFGSFLGGQFYGPQAWARPWCELYAPQRAFVLFRFDGLIGEAVAGRESDPALFVVRPLPPVLVRVPAVLRRPVLSLRPRSRKRAERSP
jgi:hypothetical protein